MKTPEIELKEGWLKRDMERAHKEIHEPVYTQSDMEALRERCAKVVDKNTCRGPCCKGRRELADSIRATTLHPEGKKP